MGDCLSVHTRQSTPYGTGSNLDQERVDVVKQGLMIAEINTCFLNHKDTQIILL